MKKSLLIIVLFPTIAFCQGFLPRWELSLSTDANSYTEKGASQSYFSLAIQPGFYPILGSGFSIEPELFVGAAKGRSPAFNLSGNLSYSFGMGYWPVVPFVEAGYGVGNGVPFYQPMERIPGHITSTGVKLINAGVGIKVMVLGGRGDLRVEYLYQSFREGNTLLGTTYLNISANRLIIGFGLLL